MLQPLYHWSAHKVFRKVIENTKSCQLYLTEPKYVEHHHYYFYSLDNLITPTFYTMMTLIPW